MVNATTWLGFLSDEQRTSLHGKAALRRVQTLLAEPVTTVDDLFVAANLLALALFRRGQAEDAVALCRSEIGYALRRRHTDDWPVLAMYALQPQINLWRIQGYGSGAESALDGFRRLENVGDGRGARFGEFALDDEDIRRMVRADLPVRKLARNVAVTDTCKILWRHRQFDELKRQSARLNHRWAHRATIPHHAAEAPWLIDALEQTPLAVTILDGTGLDGEHRLNFIRLLHLASQAVGTGHELMAKSIAIGLLERRTMLTGQFASRVTPLRCLSSLADTLLRLDLAELAVPLFRELLCKPEVASDSRLCQGIALRLDAQARPPERGDTEPESTPREPGELLAELKGILSA